MSAIRAMERMDLTPVYDLRVLKDTVPAGPMVERNKVAFAPIAPRAAEIPPRPLPAWAQDVMLPYDVDGQQSTKLNLEIVANGLRKLLEAQGIDPETIGPGKATRLLLSDWDGTVSKTSAAVYLKNKITGAPLVAPDNGQLLAIPGAASVHTARTLGELKQRYQDLVEEQRRAKGEAPNPPEYWAEFWKNYDKDFGDYNSRGQILADALVEEMVFWQQLSDLDPMSRDLINTARTDSEIVAATHEKLRQHQIHNDGVLAVGDDEVMRLCGIDPAKCKGGQRKAVTNGGTVHLYGGSQYVRGVAFHDDGDDNLIANMQLLPALFPGTRFDFYDSILKSKTTYNWKPKRIAIAHEGSGALTDARGRPMTAEQVANYASKDAPLEVDERFAGPAIVRSRMFPKHLPRAPRD
jgi:hypothetical protein